MAQLKQIKHAKIVQYDVASLLDDSDSSGGGGGGGAAAAGSLAADAAALPFVCLSSDSKTSKMELDLDLRFLPSAEGSVPARRLLSHLQADRVFAHCQLSGAGKTASCLAILRRVFGLYIDVGSLKEAPLRPRYAKDLEDAVDYIKGLGAKANKPTLGQQSRARLAAMLLGRVLLLVALVQLGLIKHPEDWLLLQLHAEKNVKVRLFVVVACWLGVTDIGCACSSSLCPLSWRRSLPSPRRSASRRRSRR